MFKRRLMGVLLGAIAVMTLAAAAPSIANATPAASVEGSIIIDDQIVIVDSDHGKCHKVYIPAGATVTNNTSYDWVLYWDDDCKKENDRVEPYTSKKTVYPARSFNFQ
jgi:hypothetical protein